MTPDQIPQVGWHMPLQKGFLLVWIALHLKQGCCEMPGGPSVRPPPITGAHEISHLSPSQADWLPASVKSSPASNSASFDQSMTGCSFLSLR